MLESLVSSFKLLQGVPKVFSLHKAYVLLRRVRTFGTPCIGDLVGGRRKCRVVEKEREREVEPLESLAASGKKREEIYDIVL